MFAKKSFAFLRSLISNTKYVLGTEVPSRPFFDSDIDICFDHGKFHELFKHYHLNSGSILIPWKPPSVQKSYLKAPLCTRLLFESFFLSRTVIWKLPVFVDCFSLCLMQQQGWGLNLFIIFCSPTFQKLNMASSCSHTYIMWPCVQNIVNSTYILLQIYRNNINCNSRCFHGYTMHSYS
jgi:hypothetical protein